MTDSQYRQNITRHVTGRMANGEMVLYYNGRLIGRIDLDSVQAIEVNDGFVVEGNQIFLVGPFDVDEQATDNCDLGWC